MTLVDALKPSAKLIYHAEKSGLYIGATGATLLSLPLLRLAPGTMNPSDDPPLVAIAKCAGIGGVVGATAAGALAIAKLTKLDADGIRERLVKIENNVLLRRTDRLALGGASVGLGLACLRIGAIADRDGVSFGSVACTKGMAWEGVCFAMLGTAVCVIVDQAVRKGIDRVREARGGKEAALVARETVEEIGDEVAKATAVRADEIVDEVKSAIEKPAVEKPVVEKPADE